MQYPTRTRCSGLMASIFFVVVHWNISQLACAERSPKLLIVVSRHGVRTPFSPTGGDLSSETFLPYSKRAKEFPVSPEEWGVSTLKGQPLTDHGKLAIRRMGEYFRLQYPALLDKVDSHNDGCKELFFYADDCLRDFQTATEFLRGMAPECLVELNITQTDAITLFNQGNFQTKSCGLADRKTVDTLLGGEEGKYAAYNNAHSSFVADVQSVVDCCTDDKLCYDDESKLTKLEKSHRDRLNARSEDRLCTLENIPSHYTGEFWAAINGSTTLSGYFASFFTLAALNNMTPIGLHGAEKTLDEVIGWYHASSSTLEIVDNAFTSPSFVSTLASHIVASMQQAATGKDISGLMHGPATSFIYMAGHDTNLVLLRNLLGLTWLADGWHLNDPGPGGMLLFELFEENGGHTVAMYFQISKPSQIRSGEKLSKISPPSRTSIALPGCGGLLRCPLSNFTSILLRAIRPECVGISDLESWVDSHRDNPSSKWIKGWELIASAIGLVFVTVLVVVPLTLYFRPKKIQQRSRKYDKMLLSPGEDI